MAEKLQLSESESDLEHRQVTSLFKPLSKKFGTGVILNYIAEDTDCAINVVSEWVEGTRNPSSGIRKQILNCLRNFRQENLTALVKATSTDLEKISATTTGAREQTIPIKAKKVGQRQKMTEQALAADPFPPVVKNKQQTIAENEKKLDDLMEKLRSEGKIT